jgi:hypothetical protein
MSRVLGRGRYIYGTYPQGPGGGGGAGGASVPLSRQRFIDGDTAQAGLNGSAAEPFATIEQFTTARDADAVSTATAGANFVGWLTPSIVGYVEDVALPASASTELRADSISLIAGTIITGSVSWAIGGGDFVPDSAAVALHNVSLSGPGNFTVTDGVGDAPTASAVVISGDEGTASAQIGGNFDSSTTTLLASVLFKNATCFGDLTAGIAVDSAQVGLIDSTVFGNVSANALICRNATVQSPAISVRDGGAGADFRLTTFTGPCVLKAVNVAGAGGAKFDGPSWSSFRELAGTRFTGTTVLVIGGYSGAAVEGAALTAASTSVSLNGTGATAGFTGENSGNHYTTSNGTPTTVTLKTGGGELPGDTILITKIDLGANVVAVKNNAGGQIASIPTLAKGFVLAQFNGSDWVFASGGSMLA